MPINLTGETRYDTRGLPEGYDPHKLYEYRLDTAIKNSSGLESFVYKIMPLSVIKSLAFAIDPTAPYKVSSSPITPANRTRIRAMASVLQQGTFLRYRTWTSNSQDTNYRGVSFCGSPYVVPLGATELVGSDPFHIQGTLPDRCKDTTKRTRNFGSDRGTLELFKGYINSPARVIRRRTDWNEIFTSTFTNEPSCSLVGGTYPRRRWGTEEFRSEFRPFGATLSLSAFNQLRDGEINFAKALCQKHAVAMLKSVEPMMRDYTLFRNLVELRDVPRSVRQLQQTATDLRKLFLSLSHSPKTRKVVFNLRGLAKDVPNEYLSYHFGWKQLWKDLNDLLELPEKASKKINFLMSRSGKPTTLRAKRVFPSVTGTGVSGFEYRQTADDYLLETNSRIERESEVRIAINRTWDFPPINSVEFNKRVYAQRTGIQPRITDVYNLIPWTWLLDWFTGLDNYIDLIETINAKDSGIVNWGMITCKTTGKLITDFQSQSTSYRTLRIDNGPIQEEQYFSKNRHQSQFVFECQTRSDVATILDVKLTSVPSTLTTYQMSILGALLAQRSKFRF